MIREGLLTAIFRHHVSRRKRGNTWILNSIVPSQAGSITGTGNITVRFSDTGQHLYTGILRQPGGLRLNILRTNNPLGATAMTVLVDRNQVDQPYVQAAAVTDGANAGDDRVYVGNSDFNVPAGRTATIDQSLAAATGWVYSLTRLFSS